MEGESGGGCCGVRSTPLLFFFQAEDGIRDLYVTGVQTCALPIYWTEEPMVLVSHPDAVRDVFRLDPAIAPAGESWEFLRPFAGEHSILLLDGDARSEERRVGKECGWRGAGRHGGREWGGLLWRKINAVAFFFSSRRRHTRSLRDWSSDVCSSDLLDRGADGPRLAPRRGARRLPSRPGDRARGRELGVPAPVRRRALDPAARRRREIGRASCRERVWMAGCGASWRARVGGAAVA